MRYRVPILLTLTSALFVGVVIAQTYPQWWLDKGVVSSQPPAAPGESGHDPVTYDAWMADNYAVANLGQAKNLAKHAYNAMEAADADSSGSAIYNMVTAFSVLPKDNFVPLTIGQLKALSAPFFSVMHAEGFAVTLADGTVVPDGSYPWTQDTTPDNLAIANLGQLKHIFSFDLEDWPGTTVSLLSPYGYRYYILGTEIDVIAQATDPDSTLASVEFFADGSSIGIISSGNSYQVSYTGNTAAEVTISVIALDSASATLATDSQVVNFSPDVDIDGMPDAYEQTIIVASLADSDLTNDLNTIEEVLSTDDFDGDGSNNGIEASKGSSPTDPSSGAANGDDDGDGLTNAEEAGFGTEIGNFDTDGDGKKDGEDGWSLDGNLSPPRVSENYVVVDLSGHLPFPTSAYQDLRIHVDDNGGTMLAYHTDSSASVKNFVTLYYNFDDVLIPPALNGDITTFYEAGDQVNNYLKYSRSMTQILNRQGKLSFQGHLDYESINTALSEFTDLITELDVRYDTTVKPLGTSVPVIPAAHLIYVTSSIDPDYAFYNLELHRSKYTDDFAGSMAGHDPIDLYHYSYFQNQEIFSQYNQSNVFQSVPIEMNWTFQAFGAHGSTLYKVKSDEFEINEVEGVKLRLLEGSVASVIHLDDDYYSNYSILSDIETDIIVRKQNVSEFAYSLDNGTIFHPSEVWLPAENKKEAIWFEGESSNDLTILQDNRVLLNGRALSFADLIGDQSEQWNSIQLTDINSHGMMVGHALTNPSDGSTPEKRVIALLKVDLVEREPDDGEVISSGGLYYESDPIPEIDLSLDSSEIDESGNLVISVSGVFKDRLSELIDASEGSYRVQNVRITCNGELLETIPMSYGGAGVMPWQPFTSENSFARTYTINASGPQTYTLRAETDANAVGNIGWDEVAVGLRNEVIVNSTPAPNLDVSIAFNQALGDEAIESAQVYFGNREPLPTDDTATESSAGSFTFTGTIKVDGVSRVCEFRIFTNTALDDETVDRFSTEFSYTDESNEVVKARGQWQETGDDTLRFYPVEFYHQSFDYNLQIAYTTELEGSPEGSVVPFVWRSSIFGDQVVEDEDSPIYLGDTQQALHPFTFSPTYQYIVDDQRRGRPKIFLVTAEELPADLDYLKPSDITSDGLLRFSIKKDASDEGLAPIEVCIVESDFGTWEPSGDDYDGAVTMPVLLTYFELMWGNKGLELLSYFQEAGGEVLLGDFSFLTGGDCDLDYWGADHPRIQIEEDKDPIWAANCLMEQLRQSLAYWEIRLAIDNSVGGTIEDVENYISLLEAAVEQQRQANLGVGIAAANVYLAGFSLANEGVDWALTVSELSQGNYSAAIGFLPFVPAGAGYAIKRADGTAAVRFTAEQVQLMKHAFTLSGRGKASTRIQIVDVLKGLLNDGKINKEIIEDLYDSGYLKLDDAVSRKYARRAKISDSGLPAGYAASDVELQHWLPLEFSRYFLSKGIDPNDVRYTSLEPTVTHRKWHSRPLGGNLPPGGHYNHEWRSWIDSHPDASSFDIFSHLSSLQLGEYNPL